MQHITKIVVFICKSKNVTTFSESIPKMLRLSRNMNVERLTTSLLVMGYWLLAVKNSVVELWLLSDMSQLLGKAKVKSAKARSSE